MEKFTTYILFSKKNGRFYIGHTNDCDHRFAQHNNKENPSTKNGVPWIKIFNEEFMTRSEAMKKELYIKKRGAKRFLEDINHDLTFFKN
mgnify:CR=1 FL=1